MTQRQNQRSRVDTERCEIFSEDDFQARGRKRQKEFIGGLLSFFRPHGHGQRRHEEHEEVGENRVQLSKGGQVVPEKPVHPEGPGRAEEDEERDKDVSRRVGEILPQVPPDQRPDEPGVQLNRHSPSYSSTV